MAISNTHKNQLLDKLLRAADFTPPAGLFVSLHSAPTGPTGANELAGAGYSRQTITFGAAVNGKSLNTNQAEFANLPAVKVTDAALWTAKTGGSFVWGGPVKVTKTFEAGDSTQIKVGELEVSFP